MTVNRKRELIYFCLGYEERRRASGSAAACNEMIDRAAREAAGDVLAPYILKAATKGYTYPQLRLSHDIPCGKNLYYKTMRRFWAVLDAAKYGA